MYHHHGLEPDLDTWYSCHKHRFKHLNFHYIYPISYKIAKKANPLKEFALLKNDITGSEPTFKMTEIAKIKRLAQVVILYYVITKKSGG